MPRATPPSRARGTSPRPSGLPSAPVRRPQRRAREASSAGEERCGSHGDRGARRTRLTRRWRGARTGGRVERDRDLAFAGVTADGQAGAVGREARAAASTATGVVAAPSAAAVETAASTAAGLLAGPVAEAAGPADAETVGVAGFAGTAARATKAAAGLATAEARARAGTAVATRRAAAGAPVKENVWVVGAALAVAPRPAKVPNVSAAPPSSTRDLRGIEMRLLHPTRGLTAGR